jgi:UDP-N-acetylglucosamine--N-acetylmuramyl-(pentapeptide) pyrophosphoryl-undecaprenol N-acetylglucosamine transferase
LSRLAAAVCTSFEETAASLPAGRARMTGNPVRPALEQQPVACQARDTLLVFGGSGGAVSLNRAVVAALTSVAGRLNLPRIVHQTGAPGLAEARRAYARASADDGGLEVETYEFIDDMAAAYGRSLLAICRAGATSVAELIATATPAILVPYPHAAGDHQTQNAQALVDAGAAVLIRDDATAPDRLAETLERLLRDRKALDSMAARAAALRRPGAAQRVLDVIRAVTQTRP